MNIDWTTVDPNIIYLLLVFGLWTSVTAIYIMGTGVLEVMALVALVASVAALTQMPTNWLAVMILVIGVSAFIVTPFIKRQLAGLAVGGLILQGLGAFFLFKGLTVSPLIIAMTLIIPYVYHQYALLPMLKSVSQRPVVEREDSLIGMQGRVIKLLDPIGTVTVDNELWTASSSEPLEPGELVIVVERKGLELRVEPFKAKRVLEDEFEQAIEES